MSIRLAVIGCAWAFAAHAQPPATPQAEAGNPAAKVPTPTSAYTGYRGWRDEPPAAWREANDEAARIGGHLGMFKPQPPTPAAPAASHAGHHGHHGGAK